MMRRFRKRWWVLFALLLAMAGGFGAKRLWDRNAVTLYVPGWSDVSAVEVSQESREGFVLEQFSFDGLDEGDRVPVLGAIPAAGDGPWPAIIFLYGIGMKLDMHDEVGQLFTGEGFALFVAEQYNRGSRKVRPESPVDELLTVRRRASFTILETRRLVDLLIERQDIAADRIYLWGGSFGAMTGVVAMAQEVRLRGGVLTLCGGDFPRLVGNDDVRSKLKISQGQALLLPLAISLLRPFDPIHTIDRIAPRPLLFQNATNDPIIPRECVEALFDKAGDPKSIKWYEASHEDVEEGIVLQALQDGLEWLQGIDRERRAQGLAARYVD